MLPILDGGALVGVLEPSEEDVGVGDRELSWYVVDILG